MTSARTYFSIQVTVCPSLSHPPESNLHSFDPATSNPRATGNGRLREDTDSPGS